MVNSAAKKLEKELIEIVEVPNDAINWSSVSLSEVIDKGKRLESSYYGVEYKRIIKTIQNSKYGYSKWLLNTAVANGTAWHPRALMIGSITVREQRPMELISCIVSILGTVVIGTSSI